MKVDKIMTLENDKITQTICSSSILAFEEYDAMTNSYYWVNHTPEYWYCSHIARALNQSMKNRFVVLENSVTEIHELAQRGEERVATEALRASGRADISLWTKKWKPRAIIEIKKGWNWDATRFTPDIERILESLRDLGRGSGVGTLNHGYFVLITDSERASQRDALEQLKRRREKTKSQLALIAEDYDGKYNIDVYCQNGRFIWNSKKRKLGSCFSVSVFKLSLIT